LEADLSQVEYYELIAARYPTQVLQKHGIIAHKRGLYELNPKYAKLTEWERASLIAMCDSAVADHIAERQDLLWSHRAQNVDPVPGSLRFQVIARAKGRCEACGVSNEIRALEVDHIVPRALGGSNALSNLQALCSKCNAEKLHLDKTDFAAVRKSFDERDPTCPFCNVVATKQEESNDLAFVFADRYPVSKGHKLVLPKRHVVEYLALHKSEIIAINDLAIATCRRLQEEDKTISGFNLGANIGVSAGQTVLHCHVHVIPRRDGDVPDPRGGIRGVIPDKKLY
jgi:diadenosine tetraphosphate (Ap4A) HIT family hydrolase